MERAPGMATKRKCPDGETETACGAGLCVMGCGFFGSAATMNMCSRCYREHVLATADIGGDAAAMLEEAANPELMGVFASAPPEKKARSSVSVAATPPAASDATAAAAMEKAATRELTDVFACVPPEKEARPSVAVAAAAPSPAAAETKAATTNRCMSCRKKVGLTGFKCRCGGTFCGAHRYADEHTCSFDYKSAGREQIAQQNPVVVSDKMTTRI